MSATPDTGVSPVPPSIKESKLKLMPVDGVEMGMPSIVDVGGNAGTGRVVGRRLSSGLGKVLVSSRGKWTSGSVLTTTYVFIGGLSSSGDAGLLSS